MIFTFPFRNNNVNCIFQFLEIFSNEILEISLLNPEENKNFELKTIAEGPDKDPYESNTSKGNDTKQNQIEPRIGIVKLGEELNSEKSKKVKNLMCEHCCKKFNKSNQRFYPILVRS